MEIKLILFLPLIIVLSLMVLAMFVFLTIDIVRIWKYSKKDKSVVKNKTKIKPFTIFCFTLAIIIFGYGFVTLLLEEYELFQTMANLSSYLSASLLLVLFGEIGRNNEEDK